MHKKDLFPVQRVAKIEASRVAAICFFFFPPFFFHLFFSMKILSIFGDFLKNFFAKIKKKNHLQSHLF